MKQQTNNEWKKIWDESLKQALEHIWNKEFELAGKKLAEAVTISSYLKFSLIKVIK